MIAGRDQVAQALRDYWKSGAPITPDRLADYLQTRCDTTAERLSDVLDKLGFCLYPMDGYTHECNSPELVSRLAGEIEQTGVKPCR